MSRIEDQIVFLAGRVCPSGQNLEHLQHLLCNLQKPINYNILFRQALPVSSQVYHHLSSLKLTDPELQDFLGRLETF